MTTTPESAPAARIAAVVVTFNRANLLERTVAALLAQTRPPDHVVIVDNASTDHTGARLRELGWDARSDMSVITRARNGGGAAGFATGLEYCVEQGYDWVWLCDDDGVPRPDALAALLAAEPQTDNVYASVAVYDDNDSLCWPVELDGEPARDIGRLPALHETLTLPFLGFFVAADLVRRIGLPDARFFLSGDDIEYVERARNRGARSFLVTGSRVDHPRPDDYLWRVAGRTLFCLRLPPWRRYFYVRNKVVIARRYYGGRLLTQTLPGLALRCLATLLREPARLRQLRAYALGVMDGLAGRFVDPDLRRQL